MPHRSRELLEEYALEIVCRTQSIQEKCNQLLSADFASEAPSMLANTLCNMCHFLEQQAKNKIQDVAKAWLSPDKVNITAKKLQIIDSIVMQLGTHIQFIDMARTPSLPWSVVKPFEKFAKRLIPNITLMLIPQWEYNYSIVTADLYEIYRELFADIGEEEIDPIFEQFSKPFHLVFFPALERKNILLHCLLGHELGHLISKKYVMDLEVDFLKNNRDEIIKYLERQCNHLEPLFRQELIKIGLEAACQLWKRGFEEVLSDIIGTILFGPAMLLSALEMSIQGEMDRKPSEKNKFYPPWRFRIREIYKTMKEISQDFFPLSESSFSGRTCSSMNKRINLIAELVETKHDLKLIDESDDTRIAYREIIKDIEKTKTRFLDRAKNSNLVASPHRLYKKLRYLIERLDNGIPPNAYEESIDQREPATIEEIINSAWFHKIAWEDQVFNSEGIFSKSIIEKREIMNLLTLKAIEYSDLERQYLK